MIHLLLLLLPHPKSLCKILQGLNILSILLRCPCVELCDNIRLLLLSFSFLSTIGRYEWSIVSITSNRFLSSLFSSTRDLIISINSFICIYDKLISPTRKLENLYNKIYYNHQYWHCIQPPKPSYTHYNTLH